MISLVMKNRGVVFVGIEDKGGGCSNIVVDDKLLKRLADMRDDGTIQPLPSLVVQRRTLGDCEAAVVMVHASLDPPVRYRGRVWVRVGPTTRQATPEEEQRLAERRRARDLPFDMRPASEAKITDLDVNYVEAHFLPLAVAHDVLEQNRRPLKQQLRSLRLLTDDTPTWGALLGLCNDPLGWVPGAFVQMLRLDGVHITDPIVSSNRISGRLEDVLSPSG